MSIEGVRFELPSQLRDLGQLYVRYRRWDLSAAWIVDPRSDNVIARIFPQDKQKNADGQRRAILPADEAGQEAEPACEDPIPPLLRKLLADHAATGLPPAMIPFMRTPASIDAADGNDEEEDDHE